MANEYVIGQVLLLKDVITDPSTSNPIDDNSDVVTIYKPDGTTATPTVVHGTTGVYSAQVTADQSGWWEYVFKSTTTGAGAGRGRFWVSPVP